jgi:hypothetical protein
MYVLSASCYTLLTKHGVMPFPSASFSQLAVMFRRRLGANSRPSNFRDVSCHRTHDCGLAGTICLWFHALAHMIAGWHEWSIMSCFYILLSQCAMPPNTWLRVSRYELSIMRPETFCRLREYDNLVSHTFIYIYIYIRMSIYVNIYVYIYIYMYLCQKENNQTKNSLFLSNHAPKEQNTIRS